MHSKQIIWEVSVYKDGSVGRGLIDKAYGEVVDIFISLYLLHKESMNPAGLYESKAFPLVSAIG